MACFRTEIFPSLHPQDFVEWLNKKFIFSSMGIQNISSSRLLCLISCWCPWGNCSIAIETVSGFQAQLGSFYSPSLQQMLVSSVVICAWPCAFSQRLMPSILRHLRWFSFVTIYCKVHFQLIFCLISIEPVRGLGFAWSDINYMCFFWDLFEFWPFHHDCTIILTLKLHNHYQKTSFTFAYTSF